MKRQLALVVLALVTGIVAGGFGANWWGERSVRGSGEVRLVVTAGDDWYGQFDHAGGCSVVPVDIYNAGDQPVSLEGILASMTVSSSLTCRPEVGHVRIAPHETRTVRAVVGFRCQDRPAEPRFSAMAGEEEKEPVSGTIDMPPIDREPLCQEGGRPAWYRTSAKAPTGAGATARLPIMLVLSSAAQGTKLSSITLKDGGAFTLHPPRLPIDVSSLAPGTAPPEVHVEFSLSVRDCARARAFGANDLTVAARFTPDGEITQTLMDGDRVVVLQLLRLLDTAC